MTESVPKDHGLPGWGWTIKKLGQWVSRTLRRTASRGTLYRILGAADLTWKKCKKWLGKRDPRKRAEYLQDFLGLYERVTANEICLVYIDESHFHRDLELGYSWGRCGERLWRVSDCPPLSDRINWYGVYNFTEGQCRIWNEGRCCKESTAEFLQRVWEWLPRGDRRVVVIWDNAPWHTAGLVQQAAADLDIDLVPLSPYSPDLNPIEGLWKWMREEVTQHQCYPTLRALFDACKNFVDTINLHPLDLIRRLWPRFELDPESEKLQLSG